MRLGSPWVRRLLTGVCAGVVVCHAQPAPAQTASLDFTISGSSTIRGWSCSAKGSVAVTPGSGSSPSAPGFTGGVQSATVTVPLKAFTCPNPEMTQHLQEAMKADKFPEVAFRLERYAGTGEQLQASGSMTITGTTLPVTFPMVVKASAQGVQVEGNTRLDMTKYGVEPPVVMLGMLKVAPQIRIEFKGLLAK